MSIEQIWCWINETQKDSDVRFRLNIISIGVELKKPLCRNAAERYLEYWGLEEFSDFISFDRFFCAISYFPNNFRVSFSVLKI